MQSKSGVKIRFLIFVTLVFVFFQCCFIQCRLHNDD